ncbi:hypothetical protein GCM10010277_74490 [Streptomyces longisporoflavus]|nr:hypothetical protein GCM10010277_74490 [Streptomyces longisporoflavus]
MAHLACGDQLGQGTDRFLDGDVGVDAVLVALAALLSVAPGAGLVLPGWETRPNLVATTTWSRRPLRSLPTTSSLWKRRYRNRPAIARPLRVGRDLLGSVPACTSADGSRRSAVTGTSHIRGGRVPTTEQQ